jgi:transcription elongation GreA/GreB family factor
LARRDAYNRDDAYRGSRDVGWQNSRVDAFGATVTVKDKKGRTETYTVVGVDELDLEPDAVSWISPIGKALLAVDMGDWITLEDGRTAKIVKIERKNDT